jgi:ribosomal protein L7/L12
MDGSVGTEPKTSAKQTEDKRAKFVELAESRTINAIRAIRVIGKLGNKSAYEYDDADVKKIISALSKEVDALKARLAQKSSKAEVEFKL